MPSASRRLAALALAGAATGLAACGPGSAADVTQIKQVITAFSSASGPAACSYLTTGALNELYLGTGHVTHDRHRAVAACSAKSASFKGARVDITRVFFPSSSRIASAFAHAPGGSERWQVFLHKENGRWLIAHIQH